MLERWVGERSDLTVVLDLLLEFLRTSGFEHNLAEPSGPEVLLARPSGPAESARRPASSPHRHAKVVHRSAEGAEVDLRLAFGELRIASQRAGPAQDPHVTARCRSRAQWPCPSAAAMSPVRRFVYIIKNAGQPPRYYTGMAAEVGSRLRAHNDGHCRHTVSGRPWHLDVVIEFGSS